MSAWHYDDSALPVGNPVNANGRDVYSLGLYDGGLHAEQYADEPDQDVIFMSPEGAKAWLDAVTKVLTPYIESGDRTARVPDPGGWDLPPEDDR